MTNKKKKPLNVRYDEALAEPTPAQATLEEIAEAGGVSVFTARAWVSGRQRPTNASLILLSRHFKMPIEELFTEEHFANAKDTEEQ